MTVGVPEISLDTWGLRYVKKKEVENKSPAETKPDQFLRDDEAALSIPNTRQQDTYGDTTTRRGTTGGKTGEQVHQHQQDKTRLGGQKGETFATSGSKRGEGATDTPTRSGQALDAKGQVKHEQTHTGSEGRNLGDPSTDPKSRGGHKIKPAKQGEGSSTKPKGSVQSTQSGKDKEPAPKGGTGSSGIQSTQTGADPKTPKAKPTGDIPDKVGRHITDVGTTTATPTSGGAPKIKAELDLAIIKCKLLKMKTKKKDFIEEGRPTRPAYRKDDDEKEDKEKSNEIVEKAIELINEAYGEMKKGDDLDLSHLDEKKGEHTWVEGNDPSGKPDKYCKDCGKTKDAKKAKDDYCRHCGSKKDKEPQTESEQVGESLSILEQEEAKNIEPEEEDTKKAEGSMEDADRDIAEYYENNPEDDARDNNNSCPTCGKGHKVVTHEDVMNVGRKKADGGTSTTGTVGAANFVYSDVEEKKKQEEDEEDKRNTDPYKRHEDP